MRLSVAVLVVTIALFPTAASARQPSGDGDPTETRCMRGEEVTGTKMGTPMICKTNAEWAQLKKDGVTLNPDGSVLVPDNDPRHVAEHGCDRSNNGGPRRDGTSAFNFQCH